MQANELIFFQSIVERRRLPGVCEKDHANSLAEVVELKSCRSDRGHYRSIMDALYRDLELSSSEDEVGVSCGSV